MRLQNLQVLINFDVRNKHRKRGRERCIKCKKSGCWCQAHIQSICIRTVSFFYVIVHYFISGWSGEKIKCNMHVALSKQSINGSHQNLREILILERWKQVSEILERWKQIPEILEKCENNCIFTYHPVEGAHHQKK